MINTIFYNAGAGAGKTYTLTHLLADVIREEKIRPDGVILTTFTKEAAAEFRERAKKVLYEEGMYDEALALEQAKIGTVHSVALDFVKKFWYILGRAQDDNVMTEEDIKQLINRSLANIPTDVELDTLQKLAQELNITKRENNLTVLDEDFWKDQLKAIINCMLQYGIGNLNPSVEFSKEYIDEIFTEDVTQDELDETLMDEALNNIKVVADEEYTNAPKDATKKRVNAIDEYLIQRKKSLYGIYYAFDADKCTTKTSRKNDKRLDKVKDVISIHERLSVSKLVGEKLKQCVDIIFSMAKRWKEQYSEYKRVHHLIDYNDMEILLEKLLAVDEVRKEIQAQYSHLFIDEFQDSSPIQVRIFEQLSKLVQKTYAVGDPKQAIYDFRGADTALTLSVINDIASEDSGNKKAKPLADSRRSVPELVYVTNAVFIPAFKKTLTPTHVHLKPVRESIGLPALRRWQVDGKDENNRKASNARKANQIMQGIQSILKEDPSAAPSDIAVLARNTNILKDVEKSLRSNGIPVTRKDSDCSNSETLDLLNACLQLVENDNDNYARLRIAFYTVNRSVAELLDEKLKLEPDKDPEKKYLEDTQLIKQVLQLRPILRKQSLSALIETLVVETGLTAYAAACSATDEVEMQLQSILSAAQAYEQHCMQTMNAATIMGWIEYSTTHPISGRKKEGVQLHTIHSSKGLEWRYVIIANIEEGFADDIIDRDVFGVKRQKEDGKMLIHYLQQIGKSDSRDAKIKRTNLYEQREKAKCEEEKRLMYVAFTRARDVLILASASDEMKQLSDAGISTETVIRRFDQPIQFGIIDDKLSTMKIEIPVVTKLEAPTAPRRDVAPSKVAPCECKVNVVEHEQEGSRIRVNELRHIASETERYQILGDCIHQALCGIEYLSDSQIYSLIAAWGLKDILTAQQIRQTWERLMQLLQKHYGSTCGCVHECAFHHHRDGQIIIGSIDLVYHLNDHEVVLVDYKTCPAGEKAIIDPAHALYAGKYSGQLATYKAALEAAGKSVKAMVIYYPISGMLVAIEQECVSTSVFV